MEEKETGNSYKPISRLSPIAKTARKIDPTNSQRTSPTGGTLAWFAETRKHNDRQHNSASKTKF